MKEVIYRMNFDYEKEEEWLNRMSARGLHLTDYFWVRYVFEKGTPGAYTYRIELLEQLHTHPESRAYIQFLEENGVECVATYLRWAIFRKKTSDGPFELYTDHSSKIRHYNRLKWLFGALGLVNLCAAIFNLFLALRVGILQGGVYNLTFSIVSLALTLFLLRFGLKYSRKVRALTKENQIFDG